MLLWIEFGIASDDDWNSDKKRARQVWKFLLTFFETFFFYICFSALHHIAKTRLLSRLEWSENWMNEMWFHSQLKLDSLVGESEQQPSRNWRITCKRTKREDVEVLESAPFSLSSHYLVDGGKGPVSNRQNKEQAERDVIVTDPLQGQPPQILIILMQRYSSSLACDEITAYRMNFKIQKRMC